MWAFLIGGFLTHLLIGPILACAWPSFNSKASQDMSKFTEESWQKAFKAVNEQFEIESLLPEQENSLKEFLEGRNLFINLPTGYGISLIFQCLLIAAGALLKKPGGSSLVVVISPLSSLMEDLVLFLNNTGVPSNRYYWRRGPRRRLQKKIIRLHRSYPFCRRNQTALWWLISFSLCFVVDTFWLRFFLSVLDDKSTTFF